MLLRTQKARGNDQREIHVITDKHMYCINETIRGLVSLNITQEGFDADSIYLKFVGLEDAHVFVDVGSCCSSKIAEYTLDNKFIKCQVVLQSFKGSLPIIQCQYPFEIPLTNITSTSITTELFMGSHFYVMYYLDAYVHNSKKPKLPKPIDAIKYRVPIIITRPFIPLQRPIKVNGTQVLSTMFLFCQGVCNAEFQLPVTDFMVGQSAQYTLKVDNTLSKHSILRIIIILEGSFKVTYRNGDQETLQLEYNEEVLGSMNAGQLKTFEGSIMIKSGPECRLGFDSSSVTPNIIYKHQIIAMVLFYQNCLCHNDPLFINVPITVVQPPQATFENAKEKNVAQYIEIEETPLSIDWKANQMMEKTVLNLEVNNQSENLFVAIDQILQSPAQQEQYNQYNAFNSNYKPISQNTMQIPQH